MKIDDEVLRIMIAAYKGTAEHLKYVADHPMEIGGIYDSLDYGAAAIVRRLLQLSDDIKPTYLPKSAFLKKRKMKRDPETGFSAKDAIDLEEKVALPVRVSEKEEHERLRAAKRAAESRNQKRRVIPKRKRVRHH